MTSVVSRIVEVCVFRMRADHPEYLLLRRASDDAIHAGIWQIVTGTIEGGETALEASLRELREETGMRPERYWVVPTTNAFYDHRRDAVNLIPFFAAQVRESDEPRLSVEHSAREWLPLNDARARLVWPGQRNGLDLVHQYIVGGQEAARLIAISLEA